MHTRVVWAVPVGLPYKLHPRLPLVLVDNPRPRPSFKISLAAPQLACYGQVWKIKDYQGGCACVGICDPLSLFSTAPSRQQAPIGTCWVVVNSCLVGNDQEMRF